MNELARRKTRLIRALTDEPVPVTITGDCMAPLLKDGARVLIKKSHFYLPGDILVFSNASGGLLSHRLLGCYYWKGEWRFLTKADNAFQPDGCIPAEQILGKVLNPRPGITVRLQSVVRFARFILRKLSASYATCR